VIASTTGLRLSLRWPAVLAVVTAVGWALSAPGANRRPVPDLPPANAAVLRFCEDNVGKKVGDGQCAALVNQALSAADAQSVATNDDGDLSYGTPVENLDDVLPGDVVRFRDATVVYRTPAGVKMVRSFPDHAAVVARNKGAGRLDLYEQNVATPGSTAERQAKTRKLALDLRGLVKGDVRFYRPVPREPAP